MVRATGGFFCAGGRKQKMKGCVERIAPKCTLSQNGYGTCIGATQATLSPLKMPCFDEHAQWSENSVWTLEFSSEENSTNPNKNVSTAWQKFIHKRIFERQCCQVGKTVSKKTVGCSTVLWSSEVTARYSSALFRHCAHWTIFLALLPAWGGTRFRSHQDIRTCVRVPLWGTRSARTRHQHTVQDLNL